MQQRIQKIKIRFAMPKPHGVRKTGAVVLFLSPYLISIILFFLYAAARVIYFSFTDYNLFNSPQFIGLQNFAELFSDPNFGYALRNTFVYALIVTFLQTFLSLLFASMLNLRIRGIQFFRAAFYLPSVTSSVVITVIFLWFFQRRGFFNFILTQISGILPSVLVFLFITGILYGILYLREKRRGMPIRIIELPVLLLSMLIAFLVVVLFQITGIIPNTVPEPIDIVWLQTQQTVLGIPRPLLAIMIQNIFTTIPTLMLLFLAGLQGIPKQLYEAARIDGAGPTTCFFKITIPSLRPVVFLVLTLSLIGTLQMFDQVAVYGDAVPLQSVITLAFYVYNRMFSGGSLPQVGLASAAAILLAGITIVAVLLQRSLLVSDEAEK